MKNPMITKAACLAGALIAAMASATAMAGQSTYVKFRFYNQTSTDVKLKYHNHESQGGSFIHIYGHGDDYIKSSSGSTTIAPGEEVHFHTHIYADQYDTPGEMAFYPEADGDSGGIKLTVVCYNPSTNTVRGNVDVGSGGGIGAPINNQLCDGGEAAAPEGVDWGYEGISSDFSSTSHYSFKAKYGGNTINRGRYVYSGER